MAWTIFSSIPSISAASASPQCFNCAEAKVSTSSLFQTSWVLSVGWLPNYLFILGEDLIVPSQHCENQMWYWIPRSHPIWEDQKAVDSTHTSYIITSGSFLSKMWRSYWNDWLWSLTLAELTAAVPNIKPHQPFRDSKGKPQYFIIHLQKNN